MSSPNALLERPEIHQNDVVEPVPMPFHGPDLDTRYSPLSTFIISSVLEHDGVVPVSVVQDRLQNEDIPAEQVVPFLEKTLVRHGLVSIEDDALAVTESGVDYIARHTGYVDEIYQQKSVRMGKFSSVNYRILNLMQREVGANGLLLPKNNETVSVSNHLKDKLGWTRNTTASNVGGLSRAGRIELERWYGGRGQPSFVSNAQVTPQGEADLEEIRLTFPKEIIELEKGGSKKSSKARVLSSGEVQGAFISITDEINNMLQELDMAPRDFTKLEQGTEAELREAIDRLRPIMTGLEKRLDAANPKLLR